MEDKVENDLSTGRQSIFIDYSSMFFKRKLNTRKCELPKRYCISLLLFLGLFIVSWMKNNFFTAILYIISTKRFSETFYPASMKWTYFEINLMESSFYWGYAVGLIPGSLLVLSFSAYRILLISVASTSTVHLFLTLALNHHVGFVIAVNFLQGLLQGPVYFACIGILVNWAPAAERTRLVTIALMGTYFGELFEVFIDTYLVQDLGEESLFYAAGISGLLWCILWSRFAADCPSQHPSLSQKEAFYLEENISSDVKIPIKLKSVPWKSMLTSLPVLVVCLAHLCFEWCSIVSIDMSTFYYHIVNNSISYHLPLALPHILLALSIPVCSFLIDFTIGKKILSVATSRKVCCSGAFAMYGVFLAVSFYNYKNEVISSTTLHTASGFLGFAIAGFTVNYLDLCPRFAVVLAAFSRTLSTTLIIIFSSIPEVIDNTNKWHIAIIATIVLSFAVAVLFAVFASGEEQPWAAPDPTIGRTEDETNSVSKTGYYPKNDSEEDAILVTDNL